MASSVPAVKAGLRTYLASWEGLRPGDGVTVRSAPGGELPDDVVELGEVTAPQTRTGLRGKAENPTMTCWVQSTRAGGDEGAIEAARGRAYALLALVEAALTADPTASGTVPAPQGTTVGDSSLVEAPAEGPGGGMRRAQVRFSITWTSHLSRRPVGPAHTTDPIPPAGLPIHNLFVAPAGGGHVAAPRPGVDLIVKTAGTLTTVTLVTPETVDGDLAVADRTFTTVATGESKIPLTHRYRNPTTGRASITYSAVTAVTVCVTRTLT
jgi:hypothetical protein